MMTAVGGWLSDPGWVARLLVCKGVNLQVRKVAPERICDSIHYAQLGPRATATMAVAVRAIHRALSAFFRDDSFLFGVLAVVFIVVLRDAEPGRLGLVPHDELGLCDHELHQAGIVVAELTVCVRIAVRPEPAHHMHTESYSHA